MKLIPKRLRQLLDRAHQALAAQRVAARSGVRRVPGDTYEEFVANCDKLLETEPPAEGCIYLLLPEPMSEEEWLLKHPPLEQQTGPANSGPTD